MKIIVSLLAAVAFLSTGCSPATSGATPTETVTVTANPQPEVETLTDEAMFLDLVRDEYPVLNGLNDSDIIELVEGACGMFDAGASVEDVFNVIINEGVTSEQGEIMAYVIGAGVTVYCPEHAGLVSGGSV